MASLDDFLRFGVTRMSIFNNYRAHADWDLTDKLTVCIPDMHLLERGPNDDFLDRNLDHERRFTELLDLLVELREAENIDLEIIQVGDMFDLWLARGNTNLLEAAYTNILGMLDYIKPVYVVGNHDIDLVQWYKDKGETFGRKWRHFTEVDGKAAVIYEHGFQADFANNQNSWSATPTITMTPQTYLWR